MSFRKFIKIAVPAALTVLIVLGATKQSDAYVSTIRDTKVNPDRAEYEIQELDKYELLCETGTVRYYYREDRDIIAVEDKETGYVMKTGIDSPFKDEATDLVKKLKKEKLSNEEIIDKYEEYAAKLTTTYIGIANSLITVEYYESDTIKYISSASLEGAESKLYTLNGNPATRRLDVNFTGIDLKLSVYITFGESSFDIDIPAESITGTGASSLAAIDIMPFFGASGGMTSYLEPETLKWETRIEKITPGYVLVPDGSGSLIRFEDYNMSFIPYVGDVYDVDRATEMYYGLSKNTVVDVEMPVMPVFGIAHGDGQMAFAAWANSGAEYMDIIVNPDEAVRNVFYTWAYPRFEYNLKYYQVYNQLGAGFFKLMDEVYDYDISMTYSLLFGDGSDGTPAADYTGMARVYREELISQGIISEKKEAEGDIPVRIDFIMADSKKGIVGTNQVVVTDADDVREILNAIIENGITNINTGLIGWQQNGETLSKPYAADYSLAIGSKSKFKKLISDFAELGIEISMSRDFTTINRSKVNYYNTAVKHVNTWYVNTNKAALLPDNMPVYNYGIATPLKSAEWLRKLSDSLSYADAITISGMSNVLTSNWDREGCVTSLSDAILIFSEALEYVSSTKKINLDDPNMYLWKYTDRYLQAPVGNSQYIFETDSVPFLQMVLNGTMEVYAPYANFSFYTQDCILRMIDYNIYPSFILTKEPSYLLSDTFLNDMYSTEFAQYEELIQDIYSQINEVLSVVKNLSWTDRIVPCDGVVINKYTDGNDVTEVVINYTESTYNYKGCAIAPETAVIVR